MIKIKNSPILTSTVASVLLAATSLVLRADDWPRWGGNDPGRNMYSPEKGLPATFDPGKFKTGSEEVDLSTTKNVKWVAKLGSQSYGNPVAANGKVYVGTNNASPRDPKYKDDRSCLYALNEYTGDFIWQLAVPKLASGKVNDWEYLGILASPCVDGNRIYLVTSRCDVVCLDAEGMKSTAESPYKDEAKYLGGPGKPPIQPGPTDGKLIWVYDMMDQLGVFPHNASNCSVITLGNKVFTCTSNGQDWTHVNVPSPLSPSVIALDKNTGEFLAEDDAKVGPNIKHGEWSSPSVGKVNGKDQVYWGGGDGVLYAFDPNPVKEADSTYLKKAWWFDAVPEEYKHDKNGKPIKYPAAEGPSEINATPVFYKNRVYVAIGQDPEHGEGVGRLVCVDATKTGDITKTGLIWDFKEIHRSISTVSIDPTTGLLFVGDFSGFVYCLDAETGKKYWEYDMKSHVWGSTLAVDGKVYCGDEDGDFRCFAADKKFKLLSEVNMGAPVLSTPIVANGTLFVATQTHLFAVAEGAKPGEAAKK
ncbi:Pyrrolo-quinoline quinone [Chthoniobacter flavus Ellin428]|uniref:Pyrrolo-quinoline quinone n=1 Tax=Chthoniobacter flavus Ellin428 TaxID=497964 RepID=B4D7Z1_9BACT|nr:PQQ-binding-like beta-propeller repeat protein [Chthoniobacter flavus]EDY17514.1 Pyrrolo-quinoline quinone [Chthoniobacter flavus Ellin428]TCO92308.1 outer membrane protein assembly factor BamB [Chthoniobacter flavus]